MIKKIFITLLFSPIMLFFVVIFIFFGSTIINSIDLNNFANQINKKHLPERTKIIGKETRCGKLNGNGKGMDYFACALIKAELSLGEINMMYAFTFIVLLITEIIIALFVNDAIIRPYVGDILVVILMYTMIRGLFRKSIKFLPIYLFVFALVVELAQYYRIVYLLHLQSNKVISTIIGTSFDLKDILCYLIATVILIIWERIEKCNNKR